MSDQKFYQSREEFDKLRKSKNYDQRQEPRETPAQQGPGGRGYQKPAFANWTREELLQHARTLEAPVNSKMSRDQIERILEQHIIN
ncbi:MAG: hypothetical protein CML06_12950 [Pseudomonadales bacterium]|mgnify:FL=1|nr:hypothetical protein [Pseudomonadales bacterium]